MNMSIRPMTADDWSFVSEIYQQGIDTNLATFQRMSPGYEEWHNSRMIGYRERIGQESFGVWRNTVLMERRSLIDTVPTER